MLFFTHGQNKRRYPSPLCALGLTVAHTHFSAWDWAAKSQFLPKASQCPPLLTEGEDLALLWFTESFPNSSVFKNPRCLRLRLFVRKHLSPHSLPQLSLSTGTLRGSGGSLWFSHSILWFSSWFFYSSVKCQWAYIHKRKKNKTQPTTPTNILQPSIHIYTLTRTFYNPLLMHRYPSLHPHAHAPYTISPLLLYMGIEKWAHPTCSCPSQGQASQTPSTHPRPTNTSHRPLPIPWTPQQAHTHTHTLTHDVPAHRTHM